MNSWPECKDLGGKIVDGKWVPDGKGLPVAHDQSQETNTVVRRQYPWYVRILDAIVNVITFPPRVIVEGLSPRRPSHRYTIYLTKNQNGIASISCDYYKITRDGIQYADQPIEEAKEIGFVPMSQVNCIN